MLQHEARCYSDVLRPELADHGVHLLNWSDLTSEQQAEVSAFFDTQISPVLTPLGLDAAHPFPYVSNLSTSWAFRLQDPVSAESVLVRVKVPRETPAVGPRPHQAYSLLLACSSASTRSSPQTRTGSSRAW